MTRFPTSTLHLSSVKAVKVILIRNHRDALALFTQYSDAKKTPIYVLVVSRTSAVYSIYSCFGF